MKKGYIKSALVLGMFAFSLGAGAQLALTTVVVGDPATGGTGPAVLNATAGIGSTFYKPAALQGIAVDGNGNVAFASYSQNRIIRIAGNNVITAGAQTTPQSLIIDPTDEYLYVESAGAVNTIVGSFLATGNTLTLSAKPAAGKLYLGEAVTGTAITAATGTPNVFVTAISADSLTITLSSSSTDTSSGEGYKFSQPVISRYLWSNSSTNTSFGFFLDSAIGKSTTTIANIPFIYSGDLVFRNGAATASPLYFDAVICSFAFDKNGNLYYADVDNHVVEEISFVSAIGTAKNKSDTLTLTQANASIAVGDLVSGYNIPRETYVSAINGNQIILSNPTTGAIKTTSGSIAFITGVTDIAGTFGVSGATGDGALAINSTLNEPRSLAFDAAGNLYINDYSNGKIREVAAVGGVINPAISTISSIISTTISKGAQGLAFDGAGNLFVSDPNNKKIYKYSPAGVISTVVGNGTLNVTPCTTTLGSTTVTTTSKFTKILPGMHLRGGGIQLGSTVVSVVDSLTLQISEAATAAGTTANLVFTSPDGVVATGTGYLDNPNSICYSSANNSLYVTENGASLVRQISGITTLPVTLVDFTAQASGSTVLLKWQTDNEINSNYFGVEKSLDGITWNQLTIVKATNKASTNNYQFVDNKPAPMNYYRLKQVDLDGQFTYSPARQVIFDGVKKGLIVYPNPIKSSFSLDMGSGFTALVHYSIVSINGKLIQSGIISNRQQTIDMANVAKGVYLFKTDNGQSAKLIKE